MKNQDQNEFDDPEKEKRSERNIEPESNLQTRRDLRNRLSVPRRFSNACRPRRDSWLRSYELLTVLETHKDCEEMHIWHGYRPNPSSFSYCLKSAFYPSNETLNVWTHFVPFLIISWRVFNIFTSLEDPLQSVAIPFWVQSFGACAVLLISSLAHLFSCHSATSQELWFCLDYGGINFYGFTLAISFEYYMCSYECFGFKFGQIQSIYATMVFILCLIGMYSTCLSRYPSCKMKHILRCGPSSFTFLMACYPCAIRSFFGQSSVFPKQCTMGENFEALFGIHCGILMLGIIFMVSHFPEICFPGSFDIVGSSHQWFHICTATGIYLQHVMAESAMREAIKSKSLKSTEGDRLSFLFWSIIFPSVLLFFIVLLLAYRTAYKVRICIKEQRIKNRKK